MDTTSEPRLLLPRRAFLQGLISACAAPAIVTGAGFRSGLWVRRCQERWIAAYDMCNDSFIVRADFAKHQLPAAKGVQLVPPHLVSRIKQIWRHQVEHCTEHALRPGFQQHSFDWTLTAMRAGEMHETSLTASIETAIRAFANDVQLRLDYRPSGVVMGWPGGSLILVDLRRALDRVQRDHRGAQLVRERREVVDEGLLGRGVGAAGGAGNSGLRRT